MRVKFDLSWAIPLWMSACLVLGMPAFGQEKKTCEIAVAALNLPDGADGLVHWRVGEAATVPIQLSTRYFSERLEVPPGTIGFYDNPVAEALPEPPDPLVALRIPPTAKLAFIVLWSEQGEGRVQWRGKVVLGSDWKLGSLRVLNGTTEPLGILAAEKRIPLSSGKSTDFQAGDWKKAFPVKIFRMQPETREVFSSKWRVAADRRELCSIISDGDSLRFRSLVDLSWTPKPPEP